MKAEEYKEIENWIGDNHPDPDNLFTGDVKIDEKIEKMWFPIIKNYHKAKVNAISDKVIEEYSKVAQRNNNGKIDKNILKFQIRSAKWVIKKLLEQ